MSRIANAAADIGAGERLNLAREKKQICPRGVPCRDAVRSCGRKRGGIRPGRIGHRDDAGRLNHITELRGRGQIPRAEIHVHSVGQKIICIRIARGRTDENRLVVRGGFSIVRDHLLK